MKKRYILLAIVAVILILSPLLLYLLRGSESGVIKDPATLPTPTPIETSNTQTTDIEDLDHNLAPTQNPEYLKKIAEQPFWDLLPYWNQQRNYSIEYMDSVDQIIITTLAANQAEKALLEQQARAWLQANGADLGELDIQYKTVSSN